MADSVQAVPAAKPPVTLVIPASTAEPEPAVFAPVAVAEVPMPTSTDRRFHIARPPGDEPTDVVGTPGVPRWGDRHPERANLAADEAAATWQSALGVWVVDVAYRPAN